MEFICLWLVQAHLHLGIYLVFAEWWSQQTPDMKWSQLFAELPSPLSCLPFSDTLCTPRQWSQQAENARMDLWRGCCVKWRTGLIPGSFVPGEGGNGKKDNRHQHLSRNLLHCAKLRWTLHKYPLRLLCVFWPTHPLSSLLADFGCKLLEGRDLFFLFVYKILQSTYIDGAV